MVLFVALANSCFSVVVFVFCFCVGLAKSFCYVTLLCYVMFFFLFFVFLGKECHPLFFLM